MSIRVKPAFLLVVFVFLAAMRVDAAFSLETRAAIEEMRARVNQMEVQAVQSITSAAEDEYIPGKELHTVLVRYRTQIYAISDASSSSFAQWRAAPAEPESLEMADYQPGQMLENALENYRTQRKVVNLVKIIKANEGAGSVEIPLTSSELLNASESALKVSAGSKPMPALSGSVNTLGITADSVDKSLESSPVADDQTVVEVQKFEFKMPRNYRIIVK